MLLKNSRVQFALPVLVMVFRIKFHYLHLFLNRIARL
jgi:hypothetical protein